METPDEKSIMTYLIGYYNKFAKMEQDDVWRRRLQNALQLQVDVRFYSKDRYGSCDSRLGFVTTA